MRLWRYATYLEIGEVNATQLGALLGEQLDADIRDLATPLDTKLLKSRTPNGDLSEPDVGDAKALIHNELPEPSRRSERGHLPVPGGDAVGQVDGLQPRARRHQRLQPAPGHPARPRQPHPPDEQQPWCLGGGGGGGAWDDGKGGGEGGVVEAGARGEVEGGEGREGAERARERLAAEHARGAAGRGLGAREGAAGEPA